MNRNDLRRVDLNLLIVFETLMHERSVTRAAEKLFLGQPAISASLARLRSLFDDPLFVRSGRSMEPTARAQEIFALPRLFGGGSNGGCTKKRNREQEEKDSPMGSDRILRPHLVHLRRCPFWLQADRRRLRKAAITQGTAQATGRLAFFPVCGTVVLAATVTASG